MKLALSAGALALSMALAGCGGGSSSSGTAQPTIPAVNPAPTPQQLASTAADALTAAMGALAGLAANANPAAAAALVTDARNAVTAAANADGHTEREADLEELVKQLEDAEDAYAAAQTPPPMTYAVSGVPAEGNERPSDWLVMAGTIKAGETGTLGSLSITCPAGGADCAITVDGMSIKSSVEGTTAVLTMAAKDQVTEDEKARTQTAEEVDRRAQGVFTALGAPFAGAAPTVSVSRKIGATAEFTARGGYEADGAAPSSLDGWRGVTLKRENTPSTGSRTDDKVVVYSDIEEPEKVNFADVYDVEDADTKAHRTATRADWVTGVGTYDSESRTLELPETITRANAARITAKGFLPPRGGTWVYGSEATHDINRRSFPGTFHGAAGEYRCEPDATDVCQVAIAAETGIYTLTGDWVFIHGTSAQAEVVDVDHLHFGYWISAPKSPAADGSYGYNVELISGGSQRFLFADLPGTTTTVVEATYEGDAAGVYAVRTGPAGQAQLTSWGEFIAKANLRASFSSGGTSTLQGGIDNFGPADGSNVDMDGWRVDLRPSNLAETTIGSVTGIAAVNGGVDATSPPAGTTATALMGAGNPSSSASWSATFYGPGRNGVENIPGVAPTGVVGKFDATFANGEIAGAFAATPKTE